ncbi:MAG: helix-turn-helix domain-containing protein [Desulfobacterales bacterium]|nr:helix-turn-helix domain-containing protein [Desulfobacterales bacterium]
MDAKIIGQYIREARKVQGLTQTEAAGYLNVGVRFLSDLENGKPTVQLDKALQVLEGMGYRVFVVDRSDQRLIRLVEENTNDG